MSRSLTDAYRERMAIKPTRCPNCDAPLAFATNVLNAKPPAPGDFVACGRCRTINKLGPEMEVLALTPDEVARIPIDQERQLQALIEPFRAVMENADEDLLTRDLSILQYFHCMKCVAEIRNGTARVRSPREYARFEVGFTRLGLQVWCPRHNLNVLHIDFESHTHPAV